MTANAGSGRRVMAQAADPVAPPPAAGDKPLLKKLLAEFAATGLPPPYLSDEEDAT